jgi:hypothetical protein
MNQDPIPQPEFQKPELGQEAQESSHAGLDHLKNDREELAAWLNKYPEEASHLQDLQDLVSLCRQSEPSQPSDETWGHVLGGVIAGIGSSGASVGRANAVSGSRTLSYFERGLRSSLMGAAAAAAFLLAVLLPHEKPPTGIEPEIPFLGRGETLPIVDANDVDLMSMEGDDTRLLVVGIPPVNAPLVLVGHGDITLVSAADEYGTRVQMSSGPDSPMIVAPLSKQPGRER